MMSKSQHPVPRRTLCVISRSTTSYDSCGEPKRMGVILSRCVRVSFSSIGSTPARRIVSMDPISADTPVQPRLR